MGRKDKETVEEVLVVKVINVYETNEGQKKMIRLVFFKYTDHILTDLLFEHDY